MKVISAVLVIAMNTEREREREREREHKCEWDRHEVL
jgi:hypothetical protein